eukprot:4635239-Pleurochrysis_carterae.AAC.1
MERRKGEGGREREEGRASSRSRRLSVHRQISVLDCADADGTRDLCVHRRNVSDHRADTGVHLIMHASSYSAPPRLGYFSRLHATEHAHMHA